MLIDGAGGTLGGFGRFALALLAAWPLAAGCAAAEPPPASDPLAPLLASLQVYTAGDSVHFVLQVMNTTEAPIEVNFGTGQTFDFVVTSGSREVWRWSEEQMFTQALQTDRIPPGVSRSYEAGWEPPADVQGELLATGILTSIDHRVEQSTRIVLP